MTRMKQRPRPPGSLPPWGRKEIHIYPHLIVRVFVDDITAFLSGRNKELVEMAEKVRRKLKRERSRGERLEVVDH